MTGRDEEAYHQAMSAGDVPWWAPDPGAVHDVNPICGCHIRARCGGCGVCTSCDGCYCGEE